MVLDQIPFQLGFDELICQLQIDLDEDLRAEAHRLAVLATQVARPKALVKEAYIDERSEDTVTINGVTFTSKVLAANLQDVDRIFAYVATCGSELDKLRSQFTDPLLAYCLDLIKSAALRAARKRVQSYVASQYGIEKTASMNPGAGDAQVWPIEQQGKLFTLLGNVEALIGVSLTPSYLMEPNKTVSGILFPTEKGFFSCQLCRREKCPGRQAPFDEQLWQERRLQSV